MQIFEVVRDATVLASIAEKVAKATNNAVCPVIPQDNTENGGCNCWGFTALALRWIEQEKWLAQCRIESFLESKTRHVPESTAAVGDIVVCRCSGEPGNWLSGYFRGDLVHTALLIDVESKAVLHKPGAWAIEASPDVRLEYPGVVVEYRRAIG